MGRRLQQVGAVPVNTRGEDRVEHGAAIFDTLYAAFGGKRPR